MTPTITPGWYRYPCTGCDHHLHREAAPGAVVYHSVQVLDPPRDGRGQWQDRFRTWRAARARGRFP